jgi:kynurenine formamidase
MSQGSMFKPARAAFATAAIVAVLGIGQGAALGDSYVVDLTHPIGTFAPTDGDITKPDLSRPIKGSIPVPTFGAQAVYQTLPDFKTNRGFFGLGQVLLAGHHGTHIDAPIHYNNNKATLETTTPDRRSLEELRVDDLVGPVVFIDISSRVQTELDKNAGVPGPKNITDFSNASTNVVTGGDIKAVEEQIRNGVWIVVNAGWSRFYKGTSLQTSPYINGWNYPGFSAEACDALITIEERKGVRINGLVMDNIGIDSGENGAGPEGDLVTDSWACHVRGLQRGWKFVENAANLGQLAEAIEGSCTLIAGAPKLVGGTGAPSRILAMCDR